MVENKRVEELELVWKSIGDIIPVNSKILVTGANGLIASNLVDALMYFNKEYQTNNLIMALCRNETKGRCRFNTHLSDKSFKLIIQDICNLKIDCDCDYIVHAASNAHPIAYSTKPVETMKTNMFGTMNILEFASNNRIKKIVYVSSSEIYGESQNGLPFREDNYGSINTLNPRSCYSESKRCAETLCMCYAKENNMEISIVRPGYIYGAQITKDNSRADAQFLRNVNKKQNIVMKSEGLQKRSYCYVMDAVSAIITVLMRGENGEAYNIANSNSEATVRQFAEIIADIGGVKVIFDLPSETEKRGYSVIQNSILSDEKLTALGWRALFDLKDGLTRTILQLEKD